MKTTKIHQFVICTAFCFSATVPLEGKSATFTNEDSQQRIAKNNYEEDEPASEKKNLTAKSTATFATRNNKLVSIHPDLIQRAMHVTVKRINASKISMDIFDAAGNIAKRYELKSKGHVKISGLNPGKYTYLILIEEKEAIKGIFEIR